MDCTDKKDPLTKRKGYNEAIRVAKKSIVVANNLEYEDFYKKLDRKEGNTCIYKLAKKRSMRRQNIEVVKYIRIRTEDFC